MNFDIIKKLGIETENPEEILEKLEELQSDYIDRIEYVDDEERAELEAELDTINEQYKLVKEGALQKKKSSLIATDEKPENVKKNIPIAVSEKDLLKDNLKASQKEKSDEEYEKELEANAEKFQKELLAKKKREEKELSDKIKADNKALAKQSKDSTSTDTGDNSQPVASKSGGSEISVALNEYYNKNNTAAFQLLNTAVNNKNNSDDPNLPFAEYVLAQMYKNGSGTTKDEQRAEFWFEKSAKHKDPQGAMQCGLIWADKNPTSVQDDENIVKRCLKYFKMAVEYSEKDAKYAQIKKDAMDRYVQVCEKKAVNFAQLNQAYDYLDELKKLESDAYIKAQIDQRKKELKKGSKGKKSHISYVDGISDIVLILSQLVIISGFVYLIAGFLENEVMAGVNNFWTFSKLPFDNKWPILLPEFIRNNLNEFIKTKGLFGVFLIYAGTLIHNFTDEMKQGRVTYVISRVLVFVPAIIVVLGTLYKFTFIQSLGTPMISVFELVYIMLHVAGGMVLALIPGWIADILF